MKSGSVATDDVTSATKLLLKTDALAAKGFKDIVQEREWNPRAWLYAVVWGETRRVGVVAAGMERKRLAMTVLTVLPFQESSAIDP